MTFDDSRERGGVVYRTKRIGPKTTFSQSAKSAKRFERSNGVDTALYKNLFF